MFFVKSSFMPQENHPVPEDCLVPPEAELSQVGRGRRKSDPHPEVDWRRGSLGRGQPAGASRDRESGTSMSAGRRLLGRNAT